MPKRTRIDKNLLADILTLYYTRFEPESIIVADLNGIVVGYIMGSLKPRRFRKKTFQLFLSTILAKFVCGRYKKIFQIFPLLLFVIFGLMKGERDPKTEDEYPAHLHINIEKEYQKSGLGSKLMSAWIQYVGEKHIHGIYLSTISTNKKAIEFFKKWGFRLFYRYKSTFWSFVSGKHVCVEIFVKKLSLHEKQN
ncbi:MAG: GNAT family N-acetyltransferase [Candidatus Omnitrophica bacterium]|nr:GNAT family N-acetyltransferase [Candidatus Omnitrophota bacterium]